MTEIPNIFSFATSELSQDAVLCYWLSWANSEIKKTDSSLHEMSKTLIHKLIGQEIELDSIEVFRQVQNIDVGLRVNNDFFLIIEDKTETSEHSNQMTRYRSVAENFNDMNGKPWGKDRVVSAYVKTGNSPQSDLPSDHKAVLVTRNDLLDILGSFKHNDQILLQFEAHLQSWEEDTNSYKTIPLDSERWTWDWRGQQGFYMWLEDEIGKWSNDTSWHYVSNPAGGFLGFFWNWRWLESADCQIYLQIEHCTKLQIRVSDAKDESGKTIKAPSSLRHHLLDLIETEKEKSGVELRISKSGRFKPGWYAGVAEVTFRDGESFVAKDVNGILDQTQTLRNLQSVMALVDALAESCKSKA